MDPGQKESKSIYIIREALELFRSPMLLWSMGKDSNVLLHLIRKACFGNIPFPVVNIDTGFEFEVLRAWRDRTAKEYGLDLRVTGPAVPRAGLFEDKLAFFNYHKTQPLTAYVAADGFDCVFVGIRGDEHGIRAKEHYFSYRDGSGMPRPEKQPVAIWDFYSAPAGSGDNGCHYRVHPLLHWSETDIWKYIGQEDIPVPPLYFAVDGYRYRSLDCEPCCTPSRSTASTVGEIIEELNSSESFEREGRDQDKEDPFGMEKLRSLGYM